jgi:hypothetical protein
MSIRCDELIIELERTCVWVCKDVKEEDGRTLTRQGKEWERVWLAFG